MLRRLVHTAAAEARTTGQMDGGDRFGEGDGIASCKRGLPVPSPAAFDGAVAKRLWWQLDFAAKDFVRDCALTSAAHIAKAGKVGLKRFGLAVCGAEGAHIGGMSLCAGAFESPHETPMSPQP